MKKTIQIILAIILSLTTIFGITAFAATQTVTSVETKRLDNIPTPTFDDSYTGVGGMAIATVKNSMFICKANEAKGYAAFYYYPEIDSDEDNYAVYRLPDVGHANAMTIDGANIYITGWVSKSANLQSGNTYNNWIIKLPRGVISSMPFNKNGNVIPKDDPSTTAVEGYSIIYPKVKNVSSNGTVTYSNYTKPIMRITKYGQTDKFIIDYTIVEDSAPKDRTFGYDFAFTKANIETASNGQTYLVVSESHNDIFVIKNNMVNKDPTRQDIAYTKDNGFFFVTWCGTNGVNNESINRCKSVILWVDIDNGSYTYPTTYGNYKVKSYTPTKINVNKAGVIGYGVTKYQTFEIESLSFNANKELLFNCNIYYTDDYSKEYEAANPDEILRADGVFKLTHDGKNNFTLQ